LQAALKALERKQDPLPVITRSIRMPSFWYHATAARRNATASSLRSVASTWLKPSREWSSTQTCTNSQPMPRLLTVLSSAMRWPACANLPSFLMSIWIGLARPIAFLALYRLCGHQNAPPVQAKAPQNASDGGTRPTRFLCDAIHDPPPAAQFHDLTCNVIGGSTRALDGP